MSNEHLEIYFLKMQLSYLRVSGEPNLNIKSIHSGKIKIVTLNA